MPELLKYPTMKGCLSGSPLKPTIPMSSGLISWTERSAGCTERYNPLFPSRLFTQCESGSLTFKVNHPSLPVVVFTASTYCNSLVPSSVLSTRYAVIIYDPRFLRFFTSMLRKSLSSAPIICSPGGTSETSNQSLFPRSCLTPGT